ncbi:MAG: peptidase MA family metallohydrolase [Pseudomonadota bacterium]
MKDRNRKSAICNLQSAIRNILLLFLAASLLFSWRSLGAGEVYLLKEAGIRVLFEPPLEPAAKQLTNIYPGVKAELERIFGWDLNLTPSILLIKESKEFQQMIKNPLTVAFALPEKDLIVIDYSKMNIHPFTLRNIFKHELCHLLLHQHIRSVPLPRWLDEGVAQWVSDGIGDIILDQKRSRLNKVALRGRFISLDSLTRGFPRREEDLILAYEESKSFVDYIIGKFGREGVLKVLEGMKQGESVHAAVLRACSVSFEDLEKGWQSSLRRKMTWFTYLSYNLYEILFSLAALITVYGSIRIMLKKRRRMKEEMEAET